MHFQHYLHVLYMINATAPSKWEWLSVCLRNENNCISVGGVEIHLPETKGSEWWGIIKFGFQLTPKYAPRKSINAFLHIRVMLWLKVHRSWILRDLHSALCIEILNWASFDFVQSVPIRHFAEGCYILN